MLPQVFSSFFQSVTLLLHGGKCEILKLKFYIMTEGKTGGTYSSKFNRYIPTQTP